MAIASIYHYGAVLLERRKAFAEAKTLDEGPFDERLWSCRNPGMFPDQALKLNPRNAIFPGGELIELKDSLSYAIPSFNSTIPTGTKEMAKLLDGPGDVLRQRMRQAGDDPLSLPQREVFYLLRARQKGKCKLVLTHGRFFETIPAGQLVGESFALAAEERFREMNKPLDPEVRGALKAIFSQQETFSRIRPVPGAAVHLRFRVMAEVRPEANLFQAKLYPDIRDNTVTLLFPARSADEVNLHLERMRIALDERNLSTMEKAIRFDKMACPLDGEMVLVQMNF
jgi:hypothetical protein